MHIPLILYHTVGKTSLHAAVAFAALHSQWVRIIPMISLLWPTSANNSKFHSERLNFLTLQVQTTHETRDLSTAEIIMPEREPGEKNDIRKKLVI